MSITFALYLKHSTKKRWKKEPFHMISWKNRSSLTKNWVKFRTSIASFIMLNGGPFSQQALISA